MGRIEKQIIVGALALVAIFLVFVIYKGLITPDEEVPNENRPTAGLGNTDWADKNANDKKPLLSMVTPGGPSGDDEHGSGDPDDKVQPRGPATGETHASSVLASGGEEQTTPETREEDPTPTTAQPNTAVLVETDWDDQLVSYKVKDGDTLGKIAQDELGSFRYWTEIEKLNEHVRNRPLQIGEDLLLPDRRSLEAQDAEDAASRSAAREARAPKADSSFRIHTVQAGDSLWKISHTYFGDGTAIEQIVKANPGVLKSKADVLQIGMQLRVPRN